jgi:hypothetical protein
MEISGILRIVTRFNTERFFFTYKVFCLNFFYCLRVIDDTEFKLKTWFEFDWIDLIKEADLTHFFPVLK